MARYILEIRLRSHNHAPEQRTRGLAFDQPATNQLRGNDLRWTAGEGVGQSCVILCDGLVTMGVA